MEMNPTQELDCSRTFQNVMKPESSLQCSQELSIDTYPELDLSSPYHPTMALHDF
jgi:hypothetical protein